MAKNSYIRGRPEKVARLSRLFAKAIDLFIALLLSIFFYPLGIILAVVYLSLSDGLQQGESVGKKLLGFKVISIVDGSTCTFKQSAIRNLPLALPLFLSIIPLWGWILTILIGLPAVGLELYLMMRLESSHRLGDVMADTTIVNIKEEPDFVGATDSWFSKNQKMS